MNKAYKYRIYPTTEQIVLMQKTFGCCRKVWNLMLSDKQRCYAETRKFGSQTPAMYKDAYPYLREADSLALANVQLNLQQALKRFLDDPAQFGFPKFKSKKRSKNSYTTNNQHGTVRVSDNVIRLPKIKEIKAKIHRKAPDEWTIKSATVSQDRDGKYYCSVLYEYEADVRPVEVREDNVLGLDYKTSCLYADSNSDLADMPKYYKQSSERLSRKQRSIKHKVVGSNNYRKAQRKIAKLHKHTANQRKDFLHKLSAEIANQYDMVCIEDLSIKDQMQSRRFRAFRRSTLDNGWYMFTVLLDYKLADRGKRLIKVDKDYPSSQICSVCGVVNPALSDDKIRKWICPICGAAHNRDVNAAVNIKNEGYRLYFSKSA